MPRLARTIAISALAGLAPLSLAQTEQLSPATEPHIIEQDHKAERPLVQMAILLDTSGSMDGLIEQAKTQLWAIVNELATSRREGQPPILEVSLYEYGKQSISLQENQLRQILPLTSDLDAVSQELFKLRTNGGEEYCGAVIEAASKGLTWSEDRNVLKMIVIAGNEPFTQGGVDYRQAVPYAISKGVIVNTIHCGDRQTGISTGWADGARLGDGEYSFIDQNAEVVVIEAPQDEELIKLSARINSTYIAFGEEATLGLRRQLEADTSAGAASPQRAAQRATAKSSGLYRNSKWDLVDAFKEGEVKLEELAEMDAEDLPEEMKDLKPEDRVAYVQEKQTEREAIQNQIQELSKARDAFVAAERAKGVEGETLESALLRAIRTQAKRVGLLFEE